MGRFLRILVFVAVVTGLVFWEVRWVGAADYADQKVRADELFSEMAGEISMIEVGLLDGREVEEVVMDFGRHLAALEEISYAMRERGELVAELAEYEEGLVGEMALARELKVLRALCEGFAGKIRAEMKDRKVDAGLFREIGVEFGEFGENLPVVEYGPVVELVAQLRGVVDQVGLGAGAVANCLGVCPEATVRTQVVELEKRLDAAIVGVDGVNREIGMGFDSVGLVERLK